MNPSHLIPLPHFSSGFTTCSALQLNNLHHFALNDKELGVHKVTSRTTHELVSPPSPAHPTSLDFPLPTEAWEAYYPKGSINPSAPIPGGFGFYVSGSAEFSKRLKEGATHAVFSYRMMLDPGWEWVKGGKLPGIYGGVGDLAYGCTGGRKEQRCKCFDLRPMWRSKSSGELYAYLPLTSNNASRLLAVPPISKENADYGFSVGRDAFKFDVAVGQWVSLAFRVKLNTVGSEDGEIQLWVNGVSVISVKGLTLRESEEGRIRGMHFQTFFGGHSDDWAAPKDLRSWFADVSGFIIE